MKLFYKCDLLHDEGQLTGMEPWPVGLSSGPPHFRSQRSDYNHMVLYTFKSMTAEYSGISLIRKRRHTEAFPGVENKYLHTTLFCNPETPNPDKTRNWINEVRSTVIAIYMPVEEKKRSVHFNWTILTGLVERKSWRLFKNCVSLIFENELHWVR